MADDDASEDDASADEHRALPKVEDEHLEAIRRLNQNALERLRAAAWRAFVQHERRRKNGL